MAILGIGLVLVSYAFAEEPKNPIQMVWDAIHDLQDRDKNLQSQIDDLRVEKASVQQVLEPVAELSVSINISKSPDDSERADVGLVVSNAGPDPATGVKLTFFYKMPLFEVEHSETDECMLQERGIIQCDLGTLEAGDSTLKVIEVSPKEYDVPTSFTADVSSSTEDRLPSNNHIVVEYVIGTSSNTEIDEEHANDRDQDGNQTDSKHDNHDVEQSQDGQFSANGNTTSDDPSAEDEDNSEQEKQSDSQTNNQTQTSNEESGNALSNDSSSTNESEEDSSQESSDQSGGGSTTGNQTSSTPNEG